jgi:NodT family efflux transporter outer membrane factor (OMF) lipoprotein
LEFKEASPASYVGVPPGTWRPAEPRDGLLKGKWWEIFHEPELDALEERLNINNQNLAQYFENFLAARAQVSQARAGHYPTLTASPGATVTGAGAAARGAGTGGAGTTAASSSTGSTTAVLVSLPFDVSWEPDLWGKVGSTVRQYQYAAQVSAAVLENERLTEEASLAVYYFELRGQDSLQRVYDKTIETDREALDLTRRLAEAGIDSDEAVAEAAVTLANAKVMGTGIALNRALYEHAIATLVGVPASTFSMPVKSLTTALPEIPLAIPSALLERRPDIAAAERTMAEANALVGVGTAAYYPTLTLSASAGLQSSVLGALFSLPAFFWSLGASASQTIFDGGLRGATVAQYAALYRADVAAYKQTVLSAFQQVEDYVASLRVLSEQTIQQDAAVEAAQRYVDIALGRYRMGLDPYLTVIVAQNILLGNEQTSVTLRVSEMTAAVQLITALGGGWDVAQLPTPAAIASPDVAR